MEHYSALNINLIYLYIYACIYTCFFYIDIGFKAEKSTNIEINNSAFNYVTLFNSLIVFDKKTYGHYLINNTQFNFNSADKGGIVRIEEIDENSSLIISDSLFDSNYASYGGIIYSKSKLTNKYVKFNNCELSENAAYEGIKKIKYFFLQI